MFGNYLSTVKNAGDEGIKLSVDAFAILEHELENSDWKLVHDAPGVLVVWAHRDAGYCHVAWDGNNRPVAWISH